MTEYEIIMTIIAFIGVVGAVLSSILSSVLFSKNKEIYLIKKEAILQSLEFLDDYLSTIKWTNVEQESSCKVKEDLTFQARNCLNKLILTCKNQEIFETFMKILYPQCFNNINIVQEYERFKYVCRQELGKKKKIIWPNKDLIFIAKIK